MPEGYLHLTCEQRCQIYALLQSGHSQAHIARQIGVDPSTISRELVRNTGARGYRFKQAHEKASQRREEASDKPRKMTPDLVELIEEKLTCRPARACFCRSLTSIETITYDNGKEFASHVEIATSLRALSYFAKPYHSWERGLNEHTNGLFRQYFPKGSDLSDFVRYRCPKGRG